MDNLLDSEKAKIFQKIETKFELYLINKINNVSFYPPNNFFSYNVLFQTILEPNGFDIFKFKELNTLEKIQENAKCCRKMGLDDFNTKYLVDILEEGASQFIDN
ncbi:hypothetical protein MJ046_20105 [Acinetobacter bereziniae]|uniref:hypothetical protein n=1 Tax=Acinetobacter bereziniae TaxID=106648 RepID=UPI0022EB59CB|nr:hypothetical protein [Acinetobacter bereziniae]MDA3442640.1 hypothetical protein [Acinetobacter bereziniae]